MKTLRIIFKYYINSLQKQLVNLPIVMVFFTSKILRYGMFLLFLYFLMNGVTNISGYSKEQMLTFYLVFNVIDTLTQLLFREVYYFRPLIVSGNFDMVLVKPFNPLIRVLLGGPDLIDMGVLVILIGVLMSIQSLNLYFIFMIINSVLISAAFHICVLSIGILTTSVDHLIMIYRDLTALMRIPIDLFTDPLRSILTFVIPVGIMFTFPAKALFGLISWQLIFVSFVVGIGSLFMSIKFWQWSLKSYQSAS